ncbi:glycoside hydrolase family 18 protein [Paractinoplanes rishiriensis]|uniref:chitinase n=1 Tax=Paractinoplanes rishiriensis TaxID=1050105 RepID=A0A919MZJ7_9ACTN|nr:glycosyl hydrolase family 18 protein [Actinoplanes rishiriensis]GIE98405.1 chitinase [Actinoplanes rishiriensis]
MRLRLLLVTLVTLVVAGCGDASPQPRPAPDPKVVGYFTNWGVYGRDFQVKDLDTTGQATRLTHLVYAFGRLADGRCTVADAWADHDKPMPAADSVDGVADRPTDPLRGNFGQLRKLKAKHPKLRVIWSFGGWTGSAGFTEAARDPAGFAASCHALLGDPRWSGVFDGIDVDWEYPNACGMACDTSGRDALARVLGALRSAFGDSALITAAVPADLGKLAAADYPAAAREANWLSAMTYDYFGTGSAGTGDTAARHRTEPHSPLTAYPGIPRDTATTTATVTELLRLGVPAGKLLLGIGFYGRGWSGASEADPGGWAEAPAKGRFEKGMEDYKILAVRCPPTGTIGGTAYAHCGDQWWSYDTPETIKTKMAYARSRSLAGAFVWELAGDTPSADLLTAVSTGLSPS